MAGVALSLVRKGKLRLGDRIGKILRGLMPQAKRVTLRQVLQHTGGLPDYSNRTRTRPGLRPIRTAMFLQRS